MKNASFAVWNDTELVLDNGAVRRVLTLPHPCGAFYTTEYAPVTGGFDHFEAVNPEFRFTANGTPYSGAGDWRLQKIEPICDDLQGEGAAVTLAAPDGGLLLTVRYLLYPGLPVVRKNLVVQNCAEQEILLESVDTECFQMKEYESPVFSWVYGDYGRRKSIGPFEGTAQDSLIVVHNPDSASGLVVGNEAAGVLKHTSVFWQTPELCSGLTHADARYPFRKYLASGEVFALPQVFTAVYNHAKTPETILNTAIPDFIRKHMGIRLSALAHKPTFLYNTWNPFLADINETLILQLVDACAEMGVKEFVIDDGWEDNLGDWGVDPVKFPHGLKPIFDYIKSRGMKPGLWVSVGSASPQSRVYHDHPEWFVKAKDGHYANLQIDNDETQAVRSACFSTGWKAYIEGVLKRLIAEHGLEYLKLDFAVVTSPYRLNPEKAGCYAEGHAHKDRNESMYLNYEGMWALFDALHREKPDLFIDCTFEAMGGLQLIDYALLKHAEGDWLSNFYGDRGEETDLRLRGMAWWRSPAMPATALVIGNAEMQDAAWECHLQSLAGALPMMLGDPRKLTAAQRGRYRFYADWLSAMEERYGIMAFRQDLPGFGEPAEGCWDGFQRINTESGAGGLLGVFRHGAAEGSRTVTVQYLAPDSVYEIRTTDGTPVAALTGAELQRVGFPVTLSERYSGVLYEVTRVHPAAQ